MTFMTKDPDLLGYEEIVDTILEEEDLAEWDDLDPEEYDDEWEDEDWDDDLDDDWEDEDDEWD